MLTIQTRRSFSIAIKTNAKQIYDRDYKYTMYWNKVKNKELKEMWNGYRRPWTRSTLCKMKCSETAIFRLRNAMCFDSFMANWMISSVFVPVRVHLESDSTGQNGIISHTSKWTVVILHTQCAIQKFTSSYFYKSHILHPVLLS